MIIITQIKRIYKAPLKIRVTKCFKCTMSTKNLKITKNSNNCNGNHSL